MRTIAIVGRPNVGKSTIFNMLVRQRLAITHQQAGVTRDIKTAVAEYNDINYTIVDTGGISKDGEFSQHIVQKSFEAIKMAHLILLIVSVEEMTAEDEELIAYVRKLSRPVLFVVNKVDNEKREWMGAEYHKYGLGEPIMISALHRINEEELWDCIETGIADNFDKEELGDNINDIQSTPDEALDDDALPNVEELDENVEGENSDVQREIKLLILGKPNTGKSSLLNALLGKDRVIVSEIPGTTRDVIEEKVEIQGEKFIIIDSAGIRRKNRIHDDIEYYSSHRAISSIAVSDVIVLMIDVLVGMTEQDKKLASLILNAGKGFIICLNKWDLIPIKQNRLVAEKDRLSYLVPQLQYVPVCPISALEKTGLDDTIQQIKKVYKQLHIQVQTSVLNRKIEEWTTQVQSPLVHKKRGKVKFVYQVSTNPIIFKAKVNSPRLFNEAYNQYLINKIRKHFGFANIPIQLDFIPNNE